MAKARRSKAGTARRRQQEDATATERARAVAAALAIAAEGGWRTARMSDIAERAGIPLARLHRILPTRGAVVAAFIRDVDAAMLADKCYRPDDPAPARDRLFDVLMCRIDALAPNKTAVAAFAREVACDPCAAICAACRLGRSLRLMLEAAGLSATGAIGILRVKGLGLIWLNTLRVWLRDDSPDLAKTMAALDKGLRQAEAAVLFLRGRAPLRPPAEGKPAP